MTIKLIDIIETSKRIGKYQIWDKILNWDVLIFNEKKWKKENLKNLKWLKFLKKNVVIFEKARPWFVWWIYFLFILKNWKIEWILRANYWNDYINIDEYFYDVEEVEEKIILFLENYKKISYLEKFTNLFELNFNFLKIEKKKQFLDYINKKKIWEEMYKKIYKLLWYKEKYTYKIKKNSYKII